MSGISLSPLHSISCIHSRSQCVIFCECLSCGEGGRSNGPHYRFCVCVGEYFVWFYFSVRFGITRAGDGVCACVCVCVCRRDQVVDYLFRELQTLLRSSHGDQ